MAESAIQKKSFDFALSIIALCRQMQSECEWVLSRQLLKSGTSIGANWEEAEAAQSRADFLSKMSIASKKARETRYWLRLLHASELTTLNVQTELSQVEEIVRLLTAIVKTTSQSPN